MNTRSRTKTAFWGGIGEKTMSIQGLEQPEIIAIEPTLRLRKFDGRYDFALKWYQDEDMVYMVDGVRRAYDMDTLTRMYTLMKRIGKGAGHAPRSTDM